MLGFQKIKVLHQIFEISTEEENINEAFDLLRIFLENM